MGGVSFCARADTTRTALRGRLTTSVADTRITVLSVPLPGLRARGREAQAPQHSLVIMAAMGGGESTR